MEWRRLLWPFSLIYDSITSVRNSAFDRGVLSSRSFNIPVIAIGNLSTGGTGKTPMAEFLLDRLKDYKRAVVSRGYGRKTRGLIIAEPHHTAEDIGDEPKQIAQKFPDVQMVLSEKRAIGLEALQNDPPDLVVLDDAFQHRYVKPGFQILLTTFQNPFYRDLILPAGNLRESARGRSRADVILVTKCPTDLDPELAVVMRKRIKPENHQQVFFTSLQYGLPMNQLEITLPFQSPIIALSGIANPVTFINHLSAHFQLQKHLKFKDHHHFAHDELQNLQTLLLQNPGWNVVTTEKDAVRLIPRMPKSLQQRIFSIPIQVQFLFNEEAKFMQRLHRFLKF